MADLVFREEEQRHRRKQEKAPHKEETVRDFGRGGQDTADDDEQKKAVGPAGGTVLKSVTLNGSPIYSFTESDGTVTVTLSDMEE